MSSRERLIAILPTNNLDAAEHFFARLGFTQPAGARYDGYRILTDDHGGEVHLTNAVETWLVPGRNPFALYLYRRDVDALAAQFKGEILEHGGAPERKPWGMYEFSLNGPDDTLIRVGWDIDDA